MATVNLGAIKFNWKGAFNNSTAYAVDDVVSSGGSSYVCILASTGNAVSNGTYWQIMAQAGTNGTNVGTTLTTQGDILYRDGSGLQRLAKGTAGQVLAMNSGANAPEYVNASGGGLFASGSNKNVEKVILTSSFSTGSSSFTDTGMQLQTAQLSANKDFIVHFTEARKENSWSQTGGRHMYSVDGGSNWINLNTTMASYNTDSVFPEANQYTTHTGAYYLSFSSGQTPWFKLQARKYGGSNAYFLNDLSENKSAIIATIVTP